jgi:hypothetical protein
MALQIIAIDTSKRTTIAGQYLSRSTIMQSKKSINNNINHATPARPEGVKASEKDFGIRKHVSRISINPVLVYYLRQAHAVLFEGRKRNKHTIQTNSPCSRKQLNFTYLFFTQILLIAKATTAYTFVRRWACILLKHFRIQGAFVLVKLGTTITHKQV